MKVKIKMRIKRRIYMKTLEVGTCNYTEYDNDIKTLVESDLFPPLNEAITTSKNSKKLVFVCSPLKAYNSFSMIDNIERAKQYSRKVVLSGDIPITPHIYFTQFLDDNLKNERKLGMECGIELLKKCDCLNLYILNGYISNGMGKEVCIAEQYNIPIFEKYINGEL